MVSSRPLFRSLTFHDHKLFLDGRYVAVPDLDFVKKFSSYGDAEVAFAALAAGAFEEWNEHPSITAKQALRIAADHILRDPHYYLFQITKGGARMANPYNKRGRRNPYPNEHAARVKAPSLFRPDTYRSKTIKPGIRIIIGKLKQTPLRKPQRGVGSRVRDPMVIQAYRFKNAIYTAAQARSWLKQHGIKARLVAATSSQAESRRAEAKRQKRRPGVRRRKVA